MAHRMEYVEAFGCAPQKDGYFRRGSPRSSIQTYNIGKRLECLVASFSEERFM